MKALKVHKYSLTIVVVAIITGIISYVIFAGSKWADQFWLYDKDFRDKALLFVLSTLVVIFGIEYIQQKQKDDLFIKNLKIIGMGYNIHFVSSYAFNLLIDLEIISETKLEEIYHSYYKSTKELCCREDSNENHRNLTNDLIRKFEDIQLNTLHINSSINLEIISNYIRKFESQYKDITEKLSFSVNNESDHIQLLFTLIEGLKKTIWELNKLNDPIQDVQLRKKKLILGLIILIDTSTVFLKKHQDIFYKSEYDYESSLLTAENLKKWNSL